jgi:hypothetical protein
MIMMFNQITHKHSRRECNLLLLSTTFYRCANRRKESHTKDLCSLHFMIEELIEEPPPNKYSKMYFLFLSIEYRSKSQINQAPPNDFIGGDELQVLG